MWNFNQYNQKLNLDLNQVSSKYKSDVLQFLHLHKPYDSMKLS
jgi:hypothetical protein